MNDYYEPKFYDQGDWERAFKKSRKYLKCEQELQLRQLHLLAVLADKLEGIEAALSELNTTHKQEENR